MRGTITAAELHNHVVDLKDPDLTVTLESNRMPDSLHERLCHDCVLEVTHGQTTPEGDKEGRNGPSSTRESTKRQLQCSDGTKHSDHDRNDSD